MERTGTQGAHSDPEMNKKVKSKTKAAVTTRRRKGAARDELRDGVRSEGTDEVKEASAEAELHSEAEDTVGEADGMEIKQLRATRVKDEVKKSKELKEVKKMKENTRRRRDAGKWQSSSGSSEQERGAARRSERRPAGAPPQPPPPPPPQPAPAGDTSLRWEGTLPDPDAEEERMRLYRLRRRERYLTARRDLCRRLNLPPALAEPDASPPAPRRAPASPYVLTADEYSSLLLLRRQKRQAEAAGAAPSPAPWHRRQVEQLAVRIAELPPVGDRRPGGQPGGCVSAAL